MSRRKKAVWVSVLLAVLTAGVVKIPDWVRDVALAIGPNKAEQVFLNQD